MEKRPSPKTMSTCPPLSSQSYQSGILHTLTPYTLVQSEYVRKTIVTTDKGTPLSFEEYPFLTISKTHQTNQKLEMKKGVPARFTQTTEEIETPISEFNFDSLIATVIDNVSNLMMMNEADVILDQLYSYTPAMNALEAMSRGIICVGGGEPENYEILGEDSLRPIVNVEPNEDSVFNALEQLVEHPEMIPVLKKQSIIYIRKHHDYIEVAKRYEKLYHELIKDSKR